MKRLEVSGAVRPLKESLGVKRIIIRHKTLYAQWRKIHTVSTWYSVFISDSFTDYRPMTSNSLLLIINI